jgi:antibiotic biosynthesis monooxygenase (ABM) superfamily enzyme
MMAPHMQYSSTVPVTIIITHKAKRGYEKEFRSWLKNINAAAIKFEGFMGVQVIEPQAQTNLEYTIIVRFDKFQNLKKWKESDIRKKYLDDLVPLTETGGTYQQLSGLEYWFTLPGISSNSPPKKHKMAVVAWLAVTPLLLLIRPIMEPFLASVGLQYPLNILVSSVVFVLIMTYAAMPFMTSIFKRWLFPK